MQSSAEIDVTKEEMLQARIDQLAKDHVRETSKLMAELRAARLAGTDEQVAKYKYTGDFYWEA